MSKTNQVIVKVKKLHPNAVIPKYAYSEDAAVDLVAISKEWDEEKQKIVFGFGLAFEIPNGHFGLLLPRSSNCKTDLLLSNSLGIVYQNYRGEIKAFFTPGHRPTKNYEVGDRVCQLLVLPYPTMVLEEVEELSKTKRGEGGFGSSGK